VPEYQFEGYTRERSGSVLPSIAPSNIYDGSDGMVIIAANQPTVFARLCKAIGQPELAEDPRFNTHAGRGANMAELDGIINEWTAQRTIDDIEKTMIAAEVPVGKVFRAADMLEDPHYKARQSLVEVPSDRWPGIMQQNVVPKLSATPGGIRWAGPDKLGAHTAEVLTELLDLSPEQVEKLKASGIV